MSAKTQGAKATSRGQPVKSQTEKGRTTKGQSVPVAGQSAKPIAKHTTKTGTTGAASAKRARAVKAADAKSAGVKMPKAAAMASKGLAASKKVSVEKVAKGASGSATSRGKPAAVAKGGRGVTSSRNTSAEASRASTNARKATASVTSAKREVDGKTAKSIGAVKGAVAENKPSARKVADAMRPVRVAASSTTSEKTKAGSKQQSAKPAGGQKETTKLTTKTSDRPAAAPEQSTGVRVAERGHAASPKAEVSKVVPEKTEAKKTDAKKTDIKKASPAVAKAPQSAAAAAFVAARKKMAAAAKPSLIVGKTSAAVGGGDQVAQKSVKKVDEKAASPAAPPRPANEPVRAPSVVKPGAPPFAMTRPGALPPERAVAKAKPGAKPPSFKALEYVVYPAHGVGQITAIESQEVAGYKLELYVISFIKDKMILKVPLPKIVSVGLRKLAEPPVMKRALDTLTGRARVKRTMWSRRAQEYEAKINSGDLIAIAEVVRDLYRSDAQPEQSYSERQLYEAALDRMAREISAVQELTDTEALKIIDEQLQKGPRRGKAEEADNDDAEDADAGIDEAA